MKMLRASCRLTLILAVLGLLALPATGGAQGILSSTTPSPAAQQDTAAPGPQAIPLSEIPLRANDALARLQAIETQLSVDPDLTIIENDLPDELAAVSDAHERLGRIVLENAAIRELVNLMAIWEAHEERLSEWTVAFEDELREVGRVAEVGGSIRDTWRLTSESLARVEGEPHQLAEQTDRVLNATETLEVVIRSRLEYLLGVKSQLDDGLEGVRPVLIELQAARASVRGRMFSRNAPPVWRLTGLREEPSRTAVRIWNEDWDSIAAFTANKSGTAVLSLILFLMFALLAVRLRDRIGSELDPTDESMMGAAETLRRPVSAAFLLTALVSQALFPRAPFIFSELVALAAIVPVYRLLPRSGNPVVNRTVRALLLLFAVVVVVDILVPPSLAYRVVTLLVALVLSGAAGWLLRGADPEKMRQTVWQTVVWRGLQLTLALGITSFVANFFGWTLIAETLLAGVLFSAYLGLGVVIGYRVIAGLIRLLPRTKIGQASHIMLGYGDVVTSRAITVLKVLSFGMWVYMALEAFEVIDPLGDWVIGVLTGAVRVGAFEFSLERVISFAAVILFSIWIARFVAFVLDVEILPRLKLKRGVSNAISTVVQWTILGAGLLTAGSALGLQAGQLAIVFGALSVGIGFGLQNIVSNFVSGLILIFEQPVKVGDKIEITSLALIGEVRRIGIRASVVRTFDGAEVIVPNGNLISSEVVNWTLSDQRRRVRVEVGVAYGTDPHRIMEILKTVAVEHGEVLKYPEPSVVFLEFGQSSLNFRLMFWTATFDDFFRIRSEVYVAVSDALQEAGVTIPFPQRDLHLKNLPESSVAQKVFSGAPAASPDEADQRKETMEEEA